MNNNLFTYNEFLAFLMVYAAEINIELSAEELAVICQKTNINNIDPIKQKVDSLSDAEALDLIEQHREVYLGNIESKAQVRQDLEDLLQSNGTHSQIERAAVHILEKLI